MVLVRKMSELETLAKALLKNGPHKQQSTHRRIRALFNKTYILDSVTGAQHVWEHEYYPQFYIPSADFAKGVLHKGQSITNGDAWLGEVKVDDRSTDKVLGFEKGPLKGLVRVQFDQMDQWFQEDEPCYWHPKDPFKRVEIVPSTRTIRVGVEGHNIAESSNVMMLFETGLPTRYYLPKTSVKWEYTAPSTTTSGCPYKGEANYYDVVVDGEAHKDAIWWYKYPTAESIAIAGRVCFYNEKVDVWIDGEKQERPKSHFG